MKHQIVTLFILFAFALPAGAQVWFDMGAKATYGPQFIYNKEIINNESVKQLYSGGHDLGGRLGLNIGEEQGLSFEILSSKLNQKYQFNAELNNLVADQEYDLNISELELAVLYRYSKLANYIEIGPSFTRVSAVSISPNNKALIDADYKDSFNDSYMSIIAGFGKFLFSNGNFGATLGLRFKYTFQDMLSDNGRDDFFPESLNPTSAVNYSEFGKSFPLEAMLVLEINLGIGYFATTSCSNRSQFSLFKSSR